jgi:hypothetical protein
VLIRFPEDKRVRLLRKASLALLKLNEAEVALEFVFTTIGIFLSSLICGYFMQATSFFARVGGI